MAILEKIVLENFSVGGECNLFHHGIVLDCFNNKSIELIKGNLYGVVGEFGNGGAALSCGIAGLTNFYEGRIIIDKEEVSIDTLIRCSWYVGVDLFYHNSSNIFKRKNKLTKKTVKEQIEEGIRKNNSDYCVKDIQEIFKLSNERINRNIEYVSGERWKASVAIGFANGRTVFCYPWFNTKDIERFQEQLHNSIDVLLNNGCMVILPTTNEENVKRISDKGHIILL